MGKAVSSPVTAAKVGIYGNLFLFGAKIAIGVYAGSMSIVSDAFHSASDALTSVILLIGLWSARLPPDREHPYGHGRAEAIASLIISLLLLFVAYDIAEHSIIQLVSGGNPVVYDPFVLAAVVLTVAFKYLMGAYAHRIGRATGKHAVVADAWHHYTDALSSVGVVFVVLFGSTNPLLDPAVSLVISLIIGYVGARLVRDVIGVIMGRADEEMESRIREVARRVGAESVHNIDVHDYGARKDVTLHVYFPEGTTVERAHELSRRIEDEVGRITSGKVTVHFDCESGLREEVAAVLRGRGIEADIEAVYVDAEGIAVVLKGEDAQEAAHILREMGMRCYVPLE